MLFFTGVHSQTADAYVNVLSKSSASERMEILSKRFFDADRDQMRGNFENFPFQFGIEGWIPILPKRTFISYGLVGFSDINIWDKILFIKFEYGFIQNDDEKSEQYISLSGNMKFLNLKNKHKFYGGFGIGFDQGYPALIGYFKYLFCLNKYVGLSTGLRLFVNETEFNKNLYNTCFSFGIQIFH
jgi:hypothetical protein